MKYELYSMGGDKIHEFTSTWQFKENEQVFVLLSSGKRNFIISHITHDVFEDGAHVVRLYCQERKVFNNAN